VTSKFLPIYILLADNIDSINIIVYAHIIDGRRIIMTHEEYVEQAHALFRSLIQVILGRLITMWGDQGLSLPQLRLLLVLAHGGPATINQIAERLHSGQSAASLLVDRLVQAHLVERSDDPADRRRAIVRLTEEGEVLMGRRRVGQQRLHAWLNSLDDDRLAIVIEIITAILSISNSDSTFEEDSHGQTITQNLFD
jgi:DNA-binding MarR family transcriptional regulator